MAKQKPSIPKGTRDFGPKEVQNRRFIFNKLQSCFELFGFEPIETPSFENLSTLTGKYGEEGDRLIFKILNSGDFAGKVEDEIWEEKDSNALSFQISEKALRYDLTVPFARYVVQHNHEINFPFKRYQMQPVWRADRPQKGRFREFTQCDADIVGSDGLWNEVELVRLYDQAFDSLGFESVTIKMNNRKILSGLVQALGIQEYWLDFTVALDKLDKFGLEKVGQEMLERGIPSQAVDALKPLLSDDLNIDDLKAIILENEAGQKGWEELEFVLEEVEQVGLSIAKLEFDMTLARGLDYYTGAIFEVKADGVEMGSIGGGGRYDDLTGIFGLNGVSGVGISFGVDRIYLVMEALGLLKASDSKGLQVLFANFGREEARQALKCIEDLRKDGVPSALYPDSAKMKKQFAYADKIQVPYIALYGSSEIQSGKVNLKNMKTGDQTEVVVSKLGAFFSES